MSILTTLQGCVQFCTDANLFTRPKLDHGFRRLSERTVLLCINTDTVKMVEGYPRSANGTMFGFMGDRDGPLHVAHHNHYDLQIILAAEWGILAAVLIRAPRAACVSLLAVAVDARDRAAKEPANALSFLRVLLSLNWLSDSSTTPSSAG